MNEEALIHQLYRALVLTKSDAEKNGFSYGSQSNCQKALQAFNRWAGNEWRTPDYPPDHVADDRPAHIEVDAGDIRVKAELYVGFAVRLIFEGPQWQGYAHIARQEWDAPLSPKDAHLEEVD